MKKFAFALGILVLMLAWGGPLSHPSFTSHMIRHLLVVAVAAPLLSLGALPYCHRFAFLLSPLLASAAELLIVWGFHLPSLHHFARHVFLGTLIEQGLFLLSGLWLWVSCLYSPVSGILGLLLTSMHMTFLGALLSLSPRTLYSHSELFDQQLGGTIMIVVGGLTYLIGGLLLTHSTLKEDPA